MNKIYYHSHSDLEYHDTVEMLSIETSGGKFSAIIRIYQNEDDDALFFTKNTDSIMENYDFNKYVVDEIMLDHIQNLLAIKDYEPIRRKYSLPDDVVVLYLFETDPEDLKSKEIEARKLFGMISKLFK